MSTANFPSDTRSVVRIESGVALTFKRKYATTTRLVQDEYRSFDGTMKRVEFTTQDVVHLSEWDVTLERRFARPTHLGSIAFNDELWNCQFDSWQDAALALYDAYLAQRRQQVKLALAS